MPCPSRRRAACRVQALPVLAGGGIRGCLCTVRASVILSASGGGKEANDRGCSAERPLGVLDAPRVRTPGEGKHVVVARVLSRVGDDLARVETDAWRVAPTPPTTCDTIERDPSFVRRRPCCPSAADSSTWRFDSIPNTPCPSSSAAAGRRCARRSRCPFSPYLAFVSSRVEAARVRTANGKRAGSFRARSLLAFDSRDQIAWSPLRKLSKSRSLASELGADIEGGNAGARHGTGNEALLQKASAAGAETEEDLDATVTSVDDQPASSWQAERSDDRVGGSKPGGDDGEEVRPTDEPRDELTEPLLPPTRSPHS